MNIKNQKLEKAKMTVILFCRRYNVTYTFKGEVGFGRPCVGIKAFSSRNYIDYNPYDTSTCENIPEFFSNIFYEIRPKDAYHKHDCLAVLVQNENYDKAIIQLAEWIVNFEIFDISIERYATGATGIQAQITGIEGTAIKIKK